MAITNLTGYTWVGKSSLLALAFETTKSYSITFTSNSVEYNTFGINSSAQSLTYTASGGSINTVYTRTSGWSNTAYKTIVISGGSDVTTDELIEWLMTWGTLTPPQDFNKSKLTFKITYDMSSEEYTKITNLVGPNFVLVPILNNVDAHTYKDIDSGSAKTFYDFMTKWGSSFNKDLISALSGDWDYGSGVSASTNAISYTTSDYNNYLYNASDVYVTTEIKFALYKATIADNVATPTGDVVDTIGYSDIALVECYFTEE